MRNLTLLPCVLLLSACMSVSDMASVSIDQLGDAGILNHSQTRRADPWRLQQDSKIFIAQGYFHPRGEANPPPNIVAEEAFRGFIDYFPYVRRAEGPLGLKQARQQASEQGAQYLLYARFANADDRIGSIEEWEDQEALDRLGVDGSTIQLTLLELNTGYLVDTATIRSRGGLLTFYDQKPEDLLGPPLREYARSLQGMAR